MHEDKVAELFKEVAVLWPRVSVLGLEVDLRGWYCFRVIDLDGRSATYYASAAVMADLRGDPILTGFRVAAQKLRGL
jgi:hypothetical protein